MHNNKYILIIINLSKYTNMVSGLITNFSHTQQVVHGFIQARMVPQSLILFNNNVNKSSMKPSQYKTKYRLWQTNQ